MAKQLGINALSDSIFYGSILKDGMTISADAKEISQNNFMSVMVQWLDYKVQQYGNPIVIKSKDGEEWTIDITKVTKED